MADRQDIDALMVGALYGELDDGERARLEAHLASHPQDRSALAGLRATREILREADLPASLATAEPPPAISALLLQEAARRAPARAAGGGGVLGFLAGLMRPFAASPALAAAAVLVMVGGAAGLLYANGTFRASEPTVASGAERPPWHAAAAGSAAPEGSAAAAPAVAEPSTVTIGASGVVDDYRVGLADGDDTGTAVGGKEAAGDAVARAEGALREADGKRTATASGFAADLGAERAAEEKTKQKGSKGAAVATGAARGGGASSAPRAAYLEVDKAKDAPVVLSFDGTRYDADAESERAAVAKNEASEPGRGAPTKKAPTAATGAAPPPPPPSSQTPPPPASKPQVVAPARDQAPAAGHDPARAAAVEAWARDQHARMVKLVNAGKCTDAGTVGAEIARKAPEYYQAHVANDRAVRACRSYVDRARRNKADDAKSRAATPRSPEPASPSDALESVK